MLLWHQTCAEKLHQSFAKVRSHSLLLEQWVEPRRYRFLAQRQERRWGNSSDRGGGEKKPQTPFKPGKQGEAPEKTPASWLMY